MRKPACLLFAMLVCLVLTTPVAADPYESLSQASSEADGAIMIVGFSSGSLLLGGISMAGNLYYVAKRERASRGWLATGYTAVALNILFGIIILTGDFSDHPVSIGLGTANLALGAIDLGFTIWAHNLPESDIQTKLSLGPAMLTDIEGNPAAGIGLTLTNW